MQGEHDRQVIQIKENDICKVNRETGYSDQTEEVRVRALYSILELFRISVGTELEDWTSRKRRRERRDIDAISRTSVSSLS